MTKNSVIPSEMVEALLADPAYDLVEKGTYLTGKCPACGKHELFISKEKPWVLQCNRLNRCGWSASTRKLYPELFENYARRYPATIKEPNKTADSYLALNRGFDLSKIRGSYSQCVFHDSATGNSYPSIRFPIPDTENATWERIIANQNSKIRKAHFTGSYAGAAWTVKDFKPTKGNQVFIVEGIFHAMALHHAGYHAIAAMSATNFPSKIIEAHKKKQIDWVLALDGDNAGRTYMKKHAQKITRLNEKASICLLPEEGKDWDDLHREQKIKPAFIKRCLLNGQIFAASSVKEKAYYEFQRIPRSSILINYSNGLYSVSVSKRDIKSQLKNEEINLASDRGKEIFILHLMVKKISNIVPTILYLEKDELLNEQAYIFNITYETGRAADKISIDGTHLSETKLFRRALLNKTVGGRLSASHKEFELILEQLLDKSPMVIEKKRFLGFDPSSETYIFNNHAYHQGKEVFQNKEGFFPTGDKGIKTALRGVQIDPSGRFSDEWLPAFIDVFHWQGLSCLAFWLGSFFVQQIRAKHKSFPFFELTGEPGAGKSTLLEFLWKCTGRRNYEGFDVMKATEAGRRRAFSQLSNLPVVLIESDRNSDIRDAKKQQFDFDACKPFFNGRGTGTLGLPTRDNEIEENMFQSSLIISQNLEVDGSEALRERVVHCHVNKSHFRPESLETARWFETTEVTELSGFLKTALLHEDHVLSTIFKAFKEIETYYFEAGITNARIAKNHAQVAACGMALKILFPNTMTEEYEMNLKNYLLSRAIKRQQRLKSDHPIIELFWENYEHLNSLHHTSTKIDKLNHARDEASIAISLTEYRAMCKKHGLELIDSRILKQHLPCSTRHKLLYKNININSKHTGTTKRCWVFKA